MTQNPNASMVMSQRPSGDILITLVSVDRLRREGDADDTILSLGRACMDAVATEIVPMTESAYHLFASRHGGRLIYPSLAAYPRPRE